MKPKKAANDFLTVSSEILGGTPVFKGTRVPVKILFDYLKAGESLSEFLDQYPSVPATLATKAIESVASQWELSPQINESIA